VRSTNGLKPNSVVHLERIEDVNRQNAPPIRCTARLSGVLSTQRFALSYSERYREVVALQSRDAATLAEDRCNSKTVPRSHSGCRTGSRDRYINARTPRAMIMTMAQHRTDKLPIATTAWPIGRRSAERLGKFPRCFST
jgi:hypothetical protein